MAPDKHSGSNLTRREFLRAAGVSSIVIASPGALAAFGSTSAEASSRAASLTPKRGGTLHFGGQGGAATDTLDAHNIIENQDFARCAQLYDPLVRMTNTGGWEYALAESITPNATSTEWTIKVRPGVITHDGKKFGARDVLFSFTRIIKGKYAGAAALGPMNLAASRIADPHTLVVKFDQPFGLFLNFLQIHYLLYMVPVGYNPKHPIGTGPFKFKSFTPGVSSTFVRNEHYWEAGRPYLDAVVSTNLADETTQVNALQSGQVHAIDYLSAASIAALHGSRFNVIVSKSGGWCPFTMRVDKTPFSDVRVRQALRLVVNRPQMLMEVFGGHGRLGNDVFGIFDPSFDHTLPQRVQDIPHAKSLLKSAGYPDLSVELITSPNAPGMVQAAQVFATQAAAAGVKVKVTNQTVTTWLAKSYLKAPFSQDYWTYLPYLLNASEATTAGAPFNETHFNVPEYQALYKKAFVSADTAVHRDVVHQMLHIDYERGGLIIPQHFPVIDAVASYVKGVRTSVTGLALGAFDFKNFWLDK
jgi:peptide/nickel transport system substrate-binding protein